MLYDEIIKEAQARIKKDPERYKLLCCITCGGTGVSYYSYTDQEWVPCHCKKPTPIPKD